MGHSCGQMPELKKFAAWTSPSCCRLDFCVFGASWRKRTRFLTDGCLAGRRDLCQGCPSHIILRGKAAGTSKNWTQVAEPYPSKLCSFLAWHVCKDCLV